MLDRPQAASSSICPFSVMATAREAALSSDLVAQGDALRRQAEDPKIGPIVKLNLLDKAETKCVD